MGEEQIKKARKEMEDVKKMQSEMDQIKRDSAEKEKQWRRDLELTKQQADAKIAQNKADLDDKLKGMGDDLKKARGEAQEAKDDLKKARDEAQGTKRRLEEEQERLKRHRTETKSNTDSEMRDFFKKSHADLIKEIKTLSSERRASSSGGGGGSSGGGGGGGLLDVVTKPLGLIGNI